MSQVNDSIPSPRKIIELEIDTLDQGIRTPQDTISADSIKAPTVPLGVTISSDAIDQPVPHNADSIELDVKTGIMYLYGNAEVEYGLISLKADYIAFNTKTNVVEATGVTDSLGNTTGNPIFNDGTQEFTARRIKYNFKSGKAFVHDVRTQQQDVYIQGSRTKYVTNTQDSTIQDYVYNENAIFTTCDHPEPHFGIRSVKQKKIGEKLIVVGPSNLEVAGIPTPLWLPFGFFPIPKGKQGGLIIPRDYEYSDQLGFGLRNIGYYTALGEHMDLKATFDIYLRGTFATYLQSNYRKRYKYNGNLALSYSNRKTENSEGNGFDRNKSFSIRWSHSQDSKSHPYNQFSGSVNIQTNDFQRTNLNNAGSVLQGQLSSNISFSRRFPDKPMSLSAYLSHSQNTATRAVTINFPTVNFQTQTLFPFKKKNDPSKDKWFEKLSFKYDGNLQSTITATDTTLFEPETFDNLKAGVRHRMSSGLSFKVLKYFNLNPSVNYTEIWNANTLNRRLDETSFQIDTTIITNTVTFEEEMIIDTSRYGEVVDENIFGFKPLRLMTAGVTMNTTIYGMLNFKKKDGWLKGLRHIVKPSINVGYTPDYTRENLGYFRTHSTDTRAEFNDPVTYSIFQNSIYERPSVNGRQLTVGYSINNIFEAKVFSKKDSSDQIVKLFKNFLISGNYNFEAEEFKWSPVNVRGTTTFFNNMTNLNFGFMLDPYSLDDNGQRSPVLQKEAKGKLLRYAGGSAMLSTRFNVKKLRALFKSKKEREKVDKEEQEREDEEEARRDEEEAFGDRGITLGGDRITPQQNSDPSAQFGNWFDRFNISHNLSFRSRIVDGNVQNEIATHTLNVQGQLQITDKWSLTIGNFGYDFKNKGLTYPSFTFYRDLHCWEMGMNWYPQRGVYSFFIRVKPGPLSFINIPSSRNNIDGLNQF